ncbi:MAG: hypothetical protein ACJ79E_17610 [Anaeromyxobacteraceae bacterium]
MMIPEGDGAVTPRAARRLALGCAAGLGAGAAASWLRFGLEPTLVLDTGTVGYLAAAFLLGLGLAAAGVCASRLGRVSGPPSPSLLGWASLVQLCALPALALTSRDLFSNLAYGALQLAGKNPYLDGPRALGAGPLAALVPPRWADSPSAYGPVTSLVSRAAAWAGVALDAPLWGAAIAFKVAMLACVLATLLAAYAHVRGDGEDGASRFALLAFTPILAWEVSAQAHNDGLLVLALMVFVWAAHRDREAIAVLALTLGTFAKTAAAPLLAVYLVLAARRSPRRAALLAAGAAAVGALFTAPYWRGAATLRGPRGSLLGDVDRHAHSLADLLCLALAPLSSRAADAAYLACWAASLALCVALVARAAWRATSVERVVHDGLVLFLAYCLTTPWFQPWYATWLLPLAVAERDARLRRIVAAYAALTVVQWGLPLDPVSTVAVNGAVAWAWWRGARAASASADVPAAA